MTKKESKQLKELEKALDICEQNLKLFINNFTDYKSVMVEQSTAWYEIHKNGIEITLDKTTTKPEDIELWVWDKILSYIALLEITYKRYIKLLPE